MDINWSKYIAIAREQNLSSFDVAKLIRTDTRRKVNISEIKRRLSSLESNVEPSRSDSVDVIDLCEDLGTGDCLLRVLADGLTFEFRTAQPEDSVVSILSRMKGVAL